MAALENGRVFVNKAKAESYDPHSPFSDNMQEVLVVTHFLFNNLACLRRGVPWKYMILIVLDHGTHVKRMSLAIATGSGGLGRVVCQSVLRVVWC